MIKNYISKFLNSLVDGDKDAASKHLSEAIKLKSSNILAEDHEEVMTAEEMHEYIEKLWKKAKTDDHKKAFLGVISKHSGKEDCSEKDFEDCAEKVCEKGKKHCDKLVHALEKSLGIDSEKVVKDLKEAKERKTEDEYVIQGKYNGKWEDVTTEVTLKAAKENLKEYRENESGTEFKLVHRRVKKKLIEASSVSKEVHDWLDKAADDFALLKSNYRLDIRLFQGHDYLKTDGEYKTSYWLKSGNEWSFLGYDEEAAINEYVDLIDDLRAAAHDEAEYQRYNDDR